MSERASGFDKVLQSIVEDLDTSLQDKARNDILRIKEEGITSFDDMIASLSNEKTSAEMRSIIYWILGQIKNDISLSVLLESLNKETKDDLIWEIAKSISNIIPENAPAQSLISISRHSPSVTARAATAYVLGRVSDPSVIDCLIQILTDQSEEDIVRSHAAESLGLLRDKRALDYLISSLRDSSTSVRFWAAFALGELRDSTAISALRELVEADKSSLEGWWSVKKEALDAIDKIIKQKDQY